MSKDKRKLYGIAGLKHAGLNYLQIAQEIHNRNMNFVFGANAFKSSSIFTPSEVDPNKLKLFRNKITFWQRLINYIKISWKRILRKG